MLVWRSRYIYNYPYIYILLPFGGWGWSHPFCSGLKATHSVWENMSFLRLSSPWSFPSGIWGNPRAISGDFNGNITNSKGKTHCHLRLSGHGNTQLGYTVICHGSEFTDYPMFWQLLAFNGNLNRYYTFRERERKTPKKLPIFFSAWTYSNFLQPLSPWINYTFRHFLVGFEVFFLKTDEIYENIWEPINNAIYVVLDSNWTI